MAGKVQGWGYLLGGGATIFPLRVSECGTIHLGGEAINLPLSVGCGWGYPLKGRWRIAVAD